jgi:nucleoside-diphosphate-sugar epimerase
MKALVTGGGGFLGRAIVEELVARGDWVRSFSRRSYPELDALGVQHQSGDVRDAAAVDRACRDVDVVFHTAAVAGIWGPWRHYYGINTLGTRHVVQACRQQRVPRLVYTSSPSVTFTGRDQCGVDETAPYATRWLCHYPHTKALAEQLVLACCGQDGVQTCALRPHLIWGPRDQHLIPRLLARARAGQLRRVGDGTNRIDMVHVRNAALAHLQAADALHAGAPVCGRAYFISQGEPVNCWRWIDDILRGAGLAPVRKSIPFRVAWYLGAVLEGAYRGARLPGEPRMTRFLAAQLGRSHYFSVERARRDFGYRPVVSTDEGMRSLANGWGTG